MSITVYLLLLLLLFSLVLCINLRMHFLFSLHFFLEFGFVFFGDKKRFALVYAEKKREAEEENANKAFFVYLSLYPDNLLLLLLFYLLLLLLLH